MREIRYVRLFAGSDGESRFEAVVVDLTLANVAPDVTPFELSESYSAERFQFEGFPAGWRSEHRARRRQFLVILAGSAAIRTSDGETRHFRPGDVLLAEDTTGRGHTTWNDRDDTCLAAVIRLRE
jgi:hypothetical protein